MAIHDLCRVFAFDCYVPEMNQPEMNFKKNSADFQNVPRNDAF